jgi:Fe-S cluster assembly iron-binding protein IscA
VTKPALEHSPATVRGTIYLGKRRTVAGRAVVPAACGPIALAANVGEERADPTPQGGTMVTLTAKATTVIRSLAERSGNPSGAGVRIDTEPERGAFTIAVAPEPHAGDQVVDDGGARLFVGEAAAPFLDNKTLDAAVNADGGVQFTVSDAPR